MTCQKRKFKTLISLFNKNELNEDYREIVVCSC